MLCSIAKQAQLSSCCSSSFSVCMFSCCSLSSSSSSSSSEIFNCSIRHASSFKVGPCRLASAIISTPPELLDHIERKIADETLGAMLRGSTLRIRRTLHGSRRAESMSSGLSKARKNSVADNGRAAQPVALKTLRHATCRSGRNTSYRPSQRNKSFSTTGQRAPEAASGAGAGIARAES